MLDDLELSAPLAVKNESGVSNSSPLGVMMGGSLRDTEKPINPAKAAMPPPLGAEDDIVQDDEQSNCKGGIELNRCNTVRISIRVLK